MTKFSGLTNLEAVETLLIERGEASNSQCLEALHELVVTRGLSVADCTQAIDLAAGGQTYLGTRDSAISCMKRYIERAEKANAPTYLTPA